jgi:hypothetical protein
VSEARPSGKGIMAEDLPNGRATKAEAIIYYQPPLRRKQTLFAKPRKEA